MGEYLYACPSCNHEAERTHSMKQCSTIVVTCERCGVAMSRIPQAVRFQEGYQRSFANENNGKGRWFSNLAQKMPGTMKDPKAYFTSQSKAEDAAKRMADTYGGSVVKG